AEFPSCAAAHGVSVCRSCCGAQNICLASRAVFVPVFKAIANVCGRFFLANSHCVGHFPKLKLQRTMSQTFAHPLGHTRVQGQSDIGRRNAGGVHPSSTDDEAAREPALTTL